MEMQGLAKQSRYIMTFEQINTTTPEGRLLMAALAKITTESQTDKTPFQVMEQITALSEKMNFPISDEMAANILASTDDDEPGSGLPSACQINQVIKLQFRPKDEPLLATVRGIHFYNGKVKYDLGLWLGDGSVDNPEYETRVYNVDSVFVRPA